MDTPPSRPRCVRLTSALSPPLPELLGRSTELERLAEATADSWLTSVVGPAGVGKSALVAQGSTTLSGPLSYACLSDCAIAEDANAAMDAALEALSQSPVEAGDPRLLILDNIDRVVDACASWLLQRRNTGALDNVSVVVTSREALRVSGEHRLELGGLDQAAATALFVTQACHSRPRWSPSGSDLLAIAAIVDAYDGHPLPLELIAGRLDIVGLRALADISARSAVDVRHHRRDTSTRHRTLADTLQTSWELLRAEDQQALAALSVCRGSFTLDDAAHLLEAPMPSVEASLRRCGQRHWLTVTSRDDEPKLRLYRTTSEFAAACLSGGDQTRLEECWTQHVLRKCWELREYLWVGELSTLSHVRALRPDLAYTSVCSGGDQAARATLLLDDLGRWDERTEVRLQRLRNAADDAPAHLAHSFSARLADCLRMQGQLSEAVNLLETALESASQRDDGREQLFILSRLVHASLESAAWSAAMDYCRRGLALGRELNSPVALRFIVSQQTLGAANGPTLEALLAMAKDVGHPAVEAKLLHNRVVATVHLDPAGAEADARAAVALYRKYGTTPQALPAIAGLATALEQLGRRDEGIAVASEALDQAREVRSSRRVADFLLILASFALGDRRLQDAERFLDEGESLVAPSPELLCQAAYLRAGLLLAQGDWRGAHAKASEAQALTPGSMPAYRALTLALQGATASFVGDRVGMTQARRQAQEVGEGLNSEHLLHMLDALGVLGECGEAMAAAWHGDEGPRLSQATPILEHLPPTALRGFVVGQMRQAQVMVRSLARLPSESLLVHEGERSVRVAGQPPIDLTRRPVLWNVWHALLETQASGQEAPDDVLGLSAAALFHKAWAGQYAEPVSAARRARTAIKELRELGLADVISRNKAGYCIASRWSVLRWESLRRRLLSDDAQP